MRSLRRNDEDDAVYAYYTYYGRVAILVGQEEEDEREGKEEDREGDKEEDKAKREEREKQKRKNRKKMIAHWTILS